MHHLVSAPSTAITVISSQPTLLTYCLCCISKAGELSHNFPHLLPLIPSTSSTTQTTKSTNWVTELGASESMWGYISFIYFCTRFSFDSYHFSTWVTLTCECWLGHLWVLFRSLLYHLYHFLQSSLCLNFSINLLSLTKFTKSPNS